MPAKTIVITGATDGHGREVAPAVAADGRRLILHGRRGNELCFAVNYLAAFDLTHRLLPMISGRIVNVAPLGQAPIQFDDLALEDLDDWRLTYHQSKLAMIICAFTLVDRLDQVTANSVHPGPYMPTKMVVEKGIPPVHTIESGVEATTRMIMDPALEMITGRFYDQHQEARVHVAEAYDPQIRSGSGGSVSSSPGPRSPVRPRSRSIRRHSAPSPARRGDRPARRPSPWPAR